MRTKLLGSLLAAAAALALAAPTLAQDDAGEARRSVILFIGDGMGPAQLTLGRLGAQRMGRDYGFDRFPRTGLVSTHSASHVVTDSAASGTSLASGVKTKNQTVGLDAKGRRVESLLEVAHREGYRTGVVTTTRLTHATPAAFLAHVWHRYEEDAIARQIVGKASSEGYPEVLIGGGRRHFDEGSLDRLRRSDYDVVVEPGELKGASGPRVAAFLADSHLPYVVDAGDAASSLAALTREAMSLLAEEGPFFLVVEGGRVDHAGHAHDAGAMMHEQLALAEAIGWALDRRSDRPELLVVATADHATGSMGITEQTDVAGLLHTRVSAEELAASADSPTAIRRAALSRGIELPDAVVASMKEHPGDGYWVQTVLGHYLSARRGVTFYDPAYQQAELGNTHGHDGTVVPVFAAGPGADRFSGLYDQTEVPRRIAAVLGLPGPGRLLDEGSAPEGDGSASTERVGAGG